MPTTTQKLEERLARVERELRELKSQLAAKNGPPWYRQIVGTVGDVKTHDQIMRLGRLIRKGKLKR